MSHLKLLGKAEVFNRQPFVPKKNFETILVSKVKDGVENLLELREEQEKEAAMEYHDYLIKNGKLSEDETDDDQTSRGPKITSRGFRMWREKSGSKVNPRENFKLGYEIPGVQTSQSSAYMPVVSDETIEEYKFRR